MDISPYLEGLSLTITEHSSYLALLKLGESPVVPIAKQVGEARTSVAYSLERLHEKGLIDITLKGSRRSYLAKPPRAVLTLLREQSELAQAKAESFEHSLPELTRLYTATPFQPRVRIFQGEGLRELFEDMLERADGEICYVGSTALIAEAVGDRFLNSWVKRRAAKGIWARAIRQRAGEVATETYTASDPMLRHYRFAPEGLQSPAVVYIYGDTVAVMTTAQESFGVVTESRDYATTMRAWFERLWKESTEC